jgi:hypothetical protein
LKKANWQNEKNLLFMVKEFHKIYGSKNVFDKMKFFCLLLGKEKREFFCRKTEK